MKSESSHCVHSGQNEVLCKITQHAIFMVSFQPPSNTQAVGSPLAGCPSLLIHYMQLLSICGESLVHPAPEKAPCYGNRRLA